MPHAEILEVVKPILKQEGVDLDVRVFNDYVQPNDQLVQKQVDANYFQTEPYLDAYNRDRKTDLVKVIGVHIEPFGAYSRKVKSLAELREGADVVIPNDPSNNSRALILLHKAGVIELKDPANALSTLRDITANPKNLKFRELDSAMLPRVLGQVDLALISTNYALDAGLNPTKDALAIEQGFDLRELPGRAPGQQGRRPCAETGQGPDQSAGEGLHRDQVQGRGAAGVLIAADLLI